MSTVSSFMDKIMTRISFLIDLELDISCLLSVQEIKGAEKITRRTRSEGRKNTAETAKLQGGI